MGIENALVKWAIIGTLLAPVYKTRDLVSRIKGGPVGFLSKEERTKITKDPTIHHIVPNGILGDIIVTTNLKYSFFDRIEVQAWMHKAEGYIRVHERGIFDNVATVVAKRMGLNGTVWPRGSKEIMKKYGCMYERGNVSTRINADYTTATLLDAICRVATACKEISEIPTLEWESPYTNE